MNEKGEGIWYKQIKALRRYISSIHVEYIADGSSPPCTQKLAL